MLGYYKVIYKLKWRSIIGEIIKQNVWDIKVLIITLLQTYKIIHILCKWVSRGCSHFSGR
jgi:hypothetical protein